ncbi:MAG: phosphoglycerate mutase [Hylemonella sp.]|uniref:phosphoglycerate mutase n=1 Tax=Hylemonella sp. TaxID=2066020 RepID=UPI0022CA8C6A|nr:phosphoglycerate mutase [Hylemonella sp.]MCZ8252233.1 phosphoglycerate mutase [Hylemonella sp.]
MHVLIPYALSEDEAARPALQGQSLPRLQALLQAMAPHTLLALPEHSPISAHEQLLAGAQGLDPQAPAWAALRAHELQLPGAGSAAWGFLTPAHWEIGQARVSLRDPQALDLREDEARALLAAMQPFFREDGLTLHYEQPLRWLVSGEPLRGVVSAPPERVIGRDVAAWLPTSPLLRRLQNEMQMLLYTHAVSEARAERGALAVNSFWLSACGALGAVPAPAQTLTLLDTLTQPAVRGDWTAWARAWQALDEALAPLQAALAAGQDVTLTLCSELVARRYTRAPRSAWQRLLQRFRPQQPSDILTLA